MSSIRLFVLGSLDERGPMHGHALRILAEEEHIDEWADVSPGAIYGAMKRLTADGLIGVLRVEREGNYPERQVFSLTDEGRASLTELRSEALVSIVHRPDPFDLALARLGSENLGGLRETLERRLAALRSRVADEHEKHENIRPYLTVTEAHVMRHDLHRLSAEIDYHHELLEALPEIIADEKSRKGLAE